MFCIVLSFVLAVEKFIVRDLRVFLYESVQEHSFSQNTSTNQQNIYFDVEEIGRHFFGSLCLIDFSIVPATDVKSECFAKGAENARVFSIHWDKVAENLDNHSCPKIHDLV